MGWQFISYSLAYITFFSLMKRERLRTYVLISQFSTKSYAVDFSLFLKNCYKLFSRYFFKNSFGYWHIFTCCWSWRFWTYIYVLGCSKIILMAAAETAIGRIYTSLVFGCMCSGCAQGTARTYIYVLGAQRVNEINPQLLMLGVIFTVNWWECFK